MKTNGKMRRNILTALLIGTMALTGYQTAFAHPHGNSGDGNSDCYMKSEGGMHQLQRTDTHRRYVDTVNVEAVNKFLDATVKERKAYTQKRAEMKAVMKSTNPEVKLAGKLAGELFDLREALLNKAKENGLSVVDVKHLIGGMGGGKGAGHGGMGMGQGSGYACPKR